MKAQHASVCVVIAAKDAADTIMRAIRSALREPEVAEVVVVDDGSTDRTFERARTADDKSGRLQVIRLPSNRGPAFARNRAIENSSAPLVSMLDADDFFFEGRFGKMLDSGGWDFVADNVVFIEERYLIEGWPLPEFMPDPCFLDLQAFVEANIVRRGRAGHELAYLHPVMRRSFLNAHGLRYNEALRLGEDYDLYARALAKGARFKLIRTCGYGALLRPNSLSRRHSTADLSRFCEADDGITALCSAEQRAVVRRHQRKIRARYELRRFLDVKSSSGMLAAIMHAIRNPSALPAIIGGLAMDKWTALAAMRRSPSYSRAPRYLLSARLAAGQPSTIRPRDESHLPQRWDRSDNLQRLPR